MSSEVSTKSRLTPLSTFTTRNGPNGVGSGRPNRSVRKVAAARLSRAATMVWLSSTAMATPPLAFGLLSYGLRVRPVLNMGSVSSLSGISVPVLAPLRRGTNENRLWAPIRGRLWLSGQAAQRDFPNEPGRGNGQQRD